MSGLKRGVIITAVVLGALAVIFLWFAAYMGGRDSGYSEGYDTGHTEGYGQGYSEGYDQGQLEGYEESYSQGYDTGQLEGYEEGQGKGYAAGRTESLSEAKLLINPSYQEMKDFLQADMTNTKQYIKDEYDCENMAADINNNAEAQGIRTAFVYIEFTGGSYCLVAFETTDRGMIFINPSDDKEMKVAVGISYFEDNGYLNPGWDDTIKEVVITW